MTYTIDFNTKPEARPGMSIEGDEWASPHPLIEGDEFDQELFGTNLRFRRNDDIIPTLPVKVEVTGRKIHVDHNNVGFHKVRVKLTVWTSENDPVEFRGWLWNSEGWEFWR